MNAKITRRKFIIRTSSIAAPIILGGLLSCDEALLKSRESYDPKYLVSLYENYEKTRLGNAKRIGDDDLTLFYAFPKSVIAELEEPPYRTTVLKWIEIEGQPKLKTEGVDIVKVDGDYYIGTGDVLPGDILIHNPNEFIVELFETYGKKYSVASYVHEKRN